MSSLEKKNGHVANATVFLTQYQPVMMLLGDNHWADDTRRTQIQNERK